MNSNKEEKTITVTLTDRQNTALSKCVLFRIQHLATITPVSDVDDDAIAREIITLKGIVDIFLHAMDESEAAHE